MCAAAGSGLFVGKQNISLKSSQEESQETASSCFWATLAAALGEEETAGYDHHQQRLTTKSEPGRPPQPWRRAVHGGGGEAAFPQARPLVSIETSGDQRAKGHEGRRGCCVWPRDTL